MQFSNETPTTVITPWQLVLNYGAKVRSTKMDGLASWNVLKDLLKKDAKPIQWTPECLTFFEQFLAIGIVEDDDGSQSHHEWERGHFLIQHGRIPKRNEFTADTVRLYQIAYNAGQAFAENKSEEYPTVVLRFYYESMMHEAVTFCEDADSLTFDDDLREAIARL
jgi:hypothetical protein